MFFRNRISEDVEDWLLDRFEWSVEEGVLRRDTPLVLPTDAFFTARSGKPDVLVPALIADILRLMNRSDDHIDCLPIDRPNAEIRSAASFQMQGEVAGAWDGDDMGSVIFYDPEMVARPLVLIATLVHEVVHHVMHRHYPDALLEGAEEELQTDAVMITSGFGLIAMMAAEEAGWLGYMRQPTRAHALAMFLAVRGLETAPCETQLTSRMRKALRSSYRQVQSLRDIVELKQRLA